MNVETNPTLLSISSSTLSSFVSESTAAPSLAKQHNSLNSPLPPLHPPSDPLPPSMSTGTMADVATGSSNLLPIPLNTNASVTVAESLAISEPLDKPNGNPSFAHESDAMHASQHAYVSLFATPHVPAHAHAHTHVLASANVAPVVSIAPSVESLTGSRSAHHNNGSHSTDSLLDKKTFFEQRPSHTKIKRLSILQSTGSTISATTTATHSLTTSTDAATATTTPLEYNKEEKDLPLIPSGVSTSPSFPSSLSSSSSTTLPLLAVAQDTNFTPLPSSLPPRPANTTTNVTATATTTSTQSHLLPALAFDLSSSQSPLSSSSPSEGHQAKEDLDPDHLELSATTIVQTAQKESSNSPVPSEQQALQQNSHRNKIMSASPIPTPMATPIMSQVAGGGHTNMFNNSSNNNNNGLHLRSPSLSSGTGSGHGQTTTNSTSSSSATTTMTTTHSASLNGTSGLATGTATGTTTSTTGAATGTNTGLGLGSSSVSDIKLKRFLEHNQRLKEQLEMRRISASEASQSLIKFVTSTKDTLLPSLWGQAASDPFSKPSSGCCTIS